MSDRAPPKKRLLAIASGGGHWIQLNRLAPAWKNLEVHYASTMPGTGKSLAAKAGQSQAVGYTHLPEANQWQKAKLVLLLFKVFVLLLRVRPHFIVTTGAAHGYFALRIGKLLGARTIWIDSIANADEMSLAGRMVRPYADIWLTQWAHLANGDDGPHFEGAVL